MSRYHYSSYVSRYSSFLSRYDNSSYVSRYHYSSYVDHAAEWFVVSLSILSIVHPHLYPQWCILIPYYTPACVMSGILFTPILSHAALH